MKEWAKLWQQNQNHNKLELSFHLACFYFQSKCKTPFLIQRNLLFTSASRVKVKNDQTIPVNSNDEDLIPPNTVHV